MMGAGLDTSTGAFFWGRDGAVLAFASGLAH
ncbi:Uncharacterised protein [Yersinia kristensenii]|nr:Uncharacterised protein [Yersinia kristensenii]